MLNVYPLQPDALGAVESSITGGHTKGELMPQPYNSFFLVIEGLDGSGKTEIARRLVERLQGRVPDRPQSVMFTYEPHDPSFGGELIRQVLRKEIAVSPRTLALAYAANRADHLHQVIEPFLSQHQHMVVCDRYYLSSLVYQTTPELPIEYVMSINAGSRRPDLTLFLNASAETCYQRMSKRSLTRELFDERLAELRHQYDAAIHYLREHGEPIIEINADGTIEEVLAQIEQIAATHFPAWLGYA